MDMLEPFFDPICTGLFLILGNWALFHAPREQVGGLFRRWSRPARLLLFRALGCVFATWGWTRALQALF